MIFEPCLNTQTTEFVFLLAVGRDRTNEWLIANATFQWRMDGFFIDVLEFDGIGHHCPITVKLSENEIDSTVSVHSKILFKRYEAYPYHHPCLWLRWSYLFEIPRMVMIWRSQPFVLRHHVGHWKASFKSELTCRFIWIGDMNHAYQFAQFLQTDLRCRRNVNMVLFQ